LEPGEEETLSGVTVNEIARRCERPLDCEGSTGESDLAPSGLVSPWSENVGGLVLLVLAPAEAANTFGEIGEEKVEDLLGVAVSTVVDNASALFVLDSKAQSKGLLSSSCKGNFNSFRKALRLTTSEPCKTLYKICV